MTRWLVLALAAASLLGLGGCAADPPTPPPEVVDGDVQRGLRLIEHYGCGTCHAVPGVPGAEGQVGPPLAGIGNRSYLGGRLTNNATNMQRWMRNPQEVDPGTAMPDLGVTEADALDLTAFLFTLK
ncbi:c-type cytochrome [Micromonospora sp. WMMD1082]|uniref:c-type cytochrome n=1 Tax=Micromonospora sp. WMMD1082 TaxID=3016104 RepID=UPI002416277B|nr:c-type cytochrome [Micromonospora sp. WMMD1082]MDG4798232.1 c-type cytochrome [Micromonospora sp. WMMD1082]